MICIHHAIFLNLGWKTLSRPHQGCRSIGCLPFHVGYMSHLNSKLLDLSWSHENWLSCNRLLKGLPCPAGSKSLREDAQIDTTHCDFRKLCVRPSFIHKKTPESNQDLLSSHIKTRCRSKVCKVPGNSNY